MKVVGIGLNKTGTTTLGVCFQHWGLRHTSLNRPAFELWRKKQYDDLLKCVDDYDSFEDWPWPLIYKKIDEHFPGTKFILTRRIDSITWYDSVCSHATRTGPTDFRKHIYGHDMPHKYKSEHINFYEEHNQRVRNYFQGREGDLLEVCWEEGDGWQQLSAFLGFERPEMCFPHANKSPL